jgi:hypothetical protein
MFTCSLIDGLRLPTLERGSTITMMMYCSAPLRRFSLILQNVRAVASRFRGRYAEALGLVFSPRLPLCVVVAERRF